MVRMILEAVAYILLIIAPFFNASARAQTRVWNTKHCTAHGCYFYQWRAYESDPARLYLFTGETQLGAWCKRRHYWRDYSVEHGTWGEAKDGPPVTVPAEFAFKKHVTCKCTGGCACEPECNCGQHAEHAKNPIIGDQPSENYGIDLTKLNNQKDAKFRYSLPDGSECCRQEALEQLGIADLADDSTQLFVTWIGDKETGEECRRNAKPLGVRFQSYTSDAPMIRSLGFVPNTLYIQDPSGKCLHAGGAETLIQAVESLRKKDPLFDPSKIPDLTKKSTPAPVLPSLSASGIGSWLKNNWLLVALIIGGWYLLWHKKQITDRRA